MPLNDLLQQFPCREEEIRTLHTLLKPSFPTPPALVLHGLTATGKSTIVRNVLFSLSVTHAIIPSRECVTSRHLLERTLTATRRALQLTERNGIGAEAKHLSQRRCDNLSSLVEQLQATLRGREHFVLVFDGIDMQREGAGGLLPGLARLGEMIPNLSSIFIVSVSTPQLFQLSGLPHLHFPAYTREDSIQILSQEPLTIFEYAENDAFHQEPEESTWLWEKYCGIIWDSLAEGAARDLASFKALCEKLWKPFVQPIVNGTIGAQEFSKLLVSRRGLLQKEDALIGGLVNEKANGGKSDVKKSHELPYYSKFIVCAAYLASFNPARQDLIYFSKTSEKKRKKKGGAVVAGKKSKHRKIPRHLLAPSPFPLERLLAILNSILPYSTPRNVQIFTEITTLLSLKLLSRSGTSSSDLLDSYSRLKVNCSWEYVVSLGRSVGFEMRDYIAT